MTISATTNGNTHTIRIQGRFDFSLQSDFRKAYEQVSADHKFVLDFAATEYMDSSALGMLLLLRDHAGGDNANIELTNCRSEIKNILEISNFQKLFTLK